MNIGEQIAYLHDKYLIYGTITSINKDTYTVEPVDKLLPGSTRSVHKSKAFYPDTKAVVVQESDGISYRIETKKYLEYQQPLKEWKSGFSLAEHPSGFLFAQNVQHKDFNPDIRIEKHSFEHAISEDMKNFCFNNRLWESSYGHSRFLRFWDEDFYFDHGVSLYIAYNKEDKPVGIMVNEHDQDKIKMYKARQGRGMAWVDPKPTGHEWVVVGSVGFYVKSDYRRRGIATQLLNYMEKDLNLELKPNQFPLAYGSSKAYTLMRKSSKILYPVDTLNRKNSVYQMVMDLDWLKALPDEDKTKENGPFFGTRWRTGFIEKTPGFNP